MWPRHGTLWAHLVSDTSYNELHAFAAAAGLPPRAFDHDHYDVPLERHHEVVGLGAQPVTGHELIRRLVASGLRVPARDRTVGSSGRTPPTSSGASGSGANSSQAGPPHVGSAQADGSRTGSSRTTDPA